MAYSPIRVKQIVITVGDENSEAVLGTVSHDNDGKVTIEGHVYPRHIELFTKILNLIEECDS